MRVLVVTNAWPSSFSPVRGIFVKEQVDSLLRMGLEVEVLVLDTAGRPYRYLTGVGRLARRAWRSPPDVIHAHYGLTGAVAVTWRLAPVVVTYHGSDVHIPWQRRISRAAALGAAANVCVSGSLAERLGRSAEVIPCGVDPALFRPLPQIDARRRLGLDPTARVLLFAGARGNAVKDWPLFADAVARLPAAQQIVALEMSGVPREEVPWRMAAADALVLTSRHEGSPMVVKEALACGLPVVAVPVGDVVERLDGVEGCEVPARSPEAIAGALERVLTRRARLDERARAAAPTLEAVAERLGALYQRISKDRR